MQLIFAIVVLILLSHPALLMHLLLLLHWRRRNIADGGGAFFLVSNALFVGSLRSLEVATAAPFSRIESRNKYRAGRSR